MNLKLWAMVGVAMVTGLSVLWRSYSAHRRTAAAELQVADRIRHAGRLVAGRGVQRVS